MRALSQLPPAHSEIVFAHYLEKEPLHDIAMGLGISTAAARKRLQRATADVVAIVGRDGFHQILAA
jgi:DNA-directed RNA polymerase specialized sigma24 family protein